MLQGVSEGVSQGVEGLQRIFGYMLSKDCVAHACRHTCASRVLETGSSLLVVKEWLGHSSITVTVKYCHLAQNGLEKAARRLEVYTYSSAAITFRQ